MKDKFEKFRLWVEGQGIEISSKENPYQCMDLAYSWVFYLNFPKVTIQHQYAYQVFTQPNSTTREYFDVIPYILGLVPKIGDLIIFDKTFTNIAGHIAVAIGENTDINFTSLDQNWAGKSAVALVTHSYAGVLGFLRPKLIAQGITDETIIPQIANMEVQQIRNRLNDTEISKNLAVELTKKTVNEYWATEVTSLKDKITNLENKRMPDLTTLSFSTLFSAILGKLTKRK